MGSHHAPMGRFFRVRPFVAGKICRRQRQRLLLLFRSTEIAYTSPLNYCVLPQTYEPNEPIPFAAVNTGTGNTTVSVYGDGDQLLWSQNFSGNTVSGSIPASITNENLTIDSVNFTHASDSPIKKPTYPETSSTKVTPDIQALIISPDPMLTGKNPITHKDVDPVRRAVTDALTAKGIKYKELLRERATWENVAKYGRYGNIKYVYLMAHGDYTFEKVYPDIYRTWTMLYDGPVLSCKQSDFVTAPGWCKPLPDKIESRNTWASMGFDKLEFFYNASCHGGLLTIDAAGQLVLGDPGQRGLFLDEEHLSDMTCALNLQDTSKARCYHGWFDRGQAGVGSPHSNWGGILWWWLGEGNTLGDALNVAIQERLDNTALNNFRLKGQGLITNIRLSHSSN